MFVLGTAGHIDHGKSALVLALTGMDPDRLPEEKERGMTIDLGFAWLRLPSGQELGIVDVPGHERFVKNMVAGVGGIDLALLVVAANEGVMPQTREHLAILDLLRVQKGVVAITKKDLVDDEWLSLVRMEIEELIAPTTLAVAKVVPVSVVTGEGLPEIVSAIDSLLTTIEPKRDLGRPRLPIDRVFTIAGAGTVVTGTLIDGSLTVGQEVEIVPSGIRSRLRGLQTHKTTLETAAFGSRVAANLVGVTTSQVQRGDVLTTPGWLTPTTMLSAKLRLLSYLHRPLRHNATVSLHTGAAETLAKVRLLEREELKPGEDTWAQLSLAKPIAAVAGDHFIIRSPMETLGGGDIVDTLAKRLRRFRPAVIQSLEVREGGTAGEVIGSLLAAKDPVELADLVAQSSLPDGDARQAIENLIQRGEVVALGQGGHRLLFSRPGWEKLAKRAAEIIGDYHHKFPVRAGMPRVELGSRLKLGTHAQSAIQRLSTEGILTEQGATVHAPSHRVQLTQTQQAKVDAFLKSLAQSPYSPPGDSTLEADLVNLLIEQSRVVKVTGNVVFSAAAYDEMVARVVATIKSGGKVTLAEVRDMFNTSRKYAQALLEHLDEKKITRRVGDERVLY